MSEPPCYGLNVHTGSKQHRCVRVPECVCSDPPPYKLLRSFTQILIVTEWVYMVAVPVKEQERSTDTIRHAFKLGSQKQVPADRLKLRLYIHIPDRAQCLWSPHASVICIIMSKASGENIRFMYSMAFAGGLLPKQKPEQHKDSTLTMLQHIEDPEAWEKIYKLVNVLWLKEATYRTVELEKGVKKA